MEHPGQALRVSAARLSVVELVTAGALVAELPVQALVRHRAFDTHVLATGAGHALEIRGARHAQGMQGRAAAVGCAILSFGALVAGYAVDTGPRALARSLGA